MDKSDFDNPNGEFKVSEKGDLVFIPNFISSDLDGRYDSKVISLLSKADLKLGELNGCGKNDPNIQFLVAPYIRLEAVYSSQIEGTETSISEVYQFEAEEDISTSSEQIDVMNYVDAMTHGFRVLSSGDKISLNFVQELHRRLLKNSTSIRGKPGVVREGQNWIAPLNAPIELATYVPPDPNSLNGLLQDWISFVGADLDIPVLLQTALMHYQLEAIHPFQDGNGRIGRLLLSLFLNDKGCLQHPILFLSFYFQQNKAEYYGRLLRVSQSSDWEGWFKFFLKGVIQQADNSIKLSGKINSLYDGYQEKILSKKVTASTIKLIDFLFRNNPVVYMSQISRVLDVHPSTAKKAISILERENILKESKIKKPKIYYAPEILELLNNPY